MRVYIYIYIHTNIYTHIHTHIQDITLPHIILLQLLYLEQIRGLLIPTLWSTRMQKHILIQTVLENRLSRVNFINICLEFNDRPQLCWNRNRFREYYLYKCFFKNLVTKSKLNYCALFSISYKYKNTSAYFCVWKKRRSNLNYPALIKTPWVFSF